MTIILANEFRNIGWNYRHGDGIFRSFLKNGSLLVFFIKYLGYIWRWITFKNLQSTFDLNI